LRESDLQAVKQAKVQVDVESGKTAVSEGGLFPLANRMALCYAARLKGFKPLPGFHLEMVFLANLGVNLSFACAATCRSPLRKRLISLILAKNPHFRFGN